MQQRTAEYRYTIYHLSRRDGTALFLHPFVKRGSFMNLHPNAELEGFFGSEPRVESFTVLRNEFYRRIDEDIRDWINERRFIPRFLLAAAVFLVVFLFMALVIHTPIPLVDELLGSAAAAIATFILMGRYFEHSRTAAERRVALRSQVDNVVFTESTYVRKLEAVLRRLERSDSSPESATGGEDTRELWDLDYHGTARVIELLRLFLSVEPWKRALRDVRRGRFSRKTTDRIAEGTVDPAVVLLYQELRAGAPTYDVPRET